MDMIWYMNFDAFSMLFPWTVVTRMCASALSHENKEFWKIARQNWDLILVDAMFSPCGMGIASVSKAPYVQMYTTLMETHMAEYRALPAFPHLVAPPWHVNPSQKIWDVRDFWDRLDSVSQNLKTKLLVLPRIHQLISSTLDAIVDDFSYYDYIRNSAAVFLEYPNVVDWTEPRALDFFDIGSHCNLTRNPLPAELENFVIDPKSRGTVLVAFGTIVNWAAAPKDIYDKFYNSLVALSDYRIVWQFTGDSSNFPNHIKALKWLPQRDILLHPKTKLFISHGGLKSVKETICAEVPVLYLPLFAEQVRNAMIAEFREYGERVYKKDFSTSEMVEKAKRILSQPSYGENVHKIKKRWIDHVIPTLDKGAFWAEYIVRHNGLPRIFDRQGKHMYWFRYWNLDVVSVFGLLVVLDVIIVV